MKLLLIILLLSISSKAQVTQESAPLQENDTLVVPSDRLDSLYLKAVDIFRKIEEGIRSSSLVEYENVLGATVCIAIGSGERGYFSTNQAISVLASYFAGRRPISFTFTRIHEKDPVPYATGRFVYIQKGNQGSAQVYVSLKWQNSRWVINQFNIY